MIRIVCQAVDAGDHLHLSVECPIVKKHRVFEVDIPELEAWLKKPAHQYESRHVLGVEIVGDEAK